MGYTKTPITLTYNGETLTLTQWAKRTGLDYGTLKWRLNRGWSIEDALYKPPQVGVYEKKYDGETLTCFGETLTYRQWRDKTGIPATAIKDRVKRLGWDPERALTVPVKKYDKEAQNKKKSDKPKIKQVSKDGYKYGALCKGCKYWVLEMCNYLLETDQSRCYTNGKRDEKCTRILKWRVKHGIELTDSERERLAKNKRGSK